MNYFINTKSQTNIDYFSLAKLSHTKYVRLFVVIYENCFM